MRNEVIFDSRGIPDIMVVFTPDELGLPAEIRGKAVKEYAISKYPNTLIEGVPYSLPYQQPAVNINHDEAIRLCEGKGPGWHLITNDEWAALAHQSRKNGTLPRGNTNSGKSHNHPEETGVTFKDASGSSKTLTGSGPVTWNHDGTAEGVADMCGNIWEHVGGIRFVNGQAQVIPNNGAAAGADQSKDSPEWAPIYTADGDPVYCNVEGGHIKLQTVEPEEKDWDGEQFTELDASLIDIQEKMRQGKGPAYERWAKVYNLKQMAAALQFLQEHGLTDYDALAEQTTAAVDRFHALAGEIQSTEARLSQTSELMAAVVSYAKTRPAFDGYKAAKYSKKYLAQHEAELADYRAAKAAINDILGGAKLPKMDALKKERRELADKKKALYIEYREAQRQMRELVAVKGSVDHLLGLTDGRENKAQER